MTGYYSAQSRIFATGANKRERPICGKVVGQLCLGRVGRESGHTRERKQGSGAWRAGIDPLLEKCTYAQMQCVPYISKAYSLGGELLFSLGCVENCFLEWPLAHLQYWKPEIFWCLSSTRVEAISQFLCQLMVVIQSLNHTLSGTRVDCGQRQGNFCKGAMVMSSKRV